MPHLRYLLVPNWFLLQKLPLQCFMNIQVDRRDFGNQIYLRTLVNINIIMNQKLDYWTLSYFHLSKNYSHHLHLDLKIIKCLFNMLKLLIFCIFSKIFVNHFLWKFILFIICQILSKVCHLFVNSTLFFLIKVDLSVIILKLIIRQ